MSRLEASRRQQRAAEVRQFLESVDAGQLSMTEFALNSIGLITTLLRKRDVFEAFVSDILEDSTFRHIFLPDIDIKGVLTIIKKFIWTLTMPFNMLPQNKMFCCSQALMRILTR
jgi:hypothetical protein